MRVRRKCPHDFARSGFVMLRELQHVAEHLAHGYQFVRNMSSPIPDSKSMKTHVLFAKNIVDHQIGINVAGGGVPMPTGGTSYESFI